MNETFNMQENREETAESQLFGLPRTWAGSLIGIILFTVVLLFFRMRESVFVLALLLPGNFIVESLGLTNNALQIYNAEVLAHSISYIISCIPSAILGATILSKKTRWFGFILLITYIIVSLFYGLFLYWLILDV